MAFSKTTLYPKEPQLISGFAKALGHSARITILRQLSHVEKHTVEELQKEHPISQPTMSDHLRILRAAHIVHYREKFPFTYYWLNRENLALAEQYFSQFFQEILGPDSNLTP
jgi:DNA-binding transcriptional ArsR family regulator